MNSKTSNKELYSIREWAPLSHVISNLPATTRLAGLFPLPAVDVNITCIAAEEEFLALGSSAGIVFWCNRHTGDVQKLRAEVCSRITCVKIVNSVEFMVAAGSSTGQVSVFQIQKPLPADLDFPCARRAKPVQRYTIRDLHGSSVSCCEWSRNGMKLFSGDRQGVVVLTEFDYVNHLSKSLELLSESYEIVQLSVHQSYLLVSTLYRSIVAQRSESTGQWHIAQVGKKDRKQLIDCGGVFLRSKAAAQQQKQPPQLICGRPGLRFWIADTAGNVEKTLLFREAVARSPTWEIPILNPKAMTVAPQHATTASPDKTNEARNFHALYVYGGGQQPGGDALVVTHDDETLYILNLDRLCVEAVGRGFRKILDFCVCGQEIFVLEGERSLLRLAPVPEKPNKAAKVIFNPLLPPPVPPLGIIRRVEAPLGHEASDRPTAEECFELPPIEALHLNIPIELAVESPRAEQNRRLEIFNQISSMDFEQAILHHSNGPPPVNGARKKRRRDRSALPAQGGIVEIGQAALRLDAVEMAPSPLTTTPQKPQTLQLTTKSTPLEASFCLNSIIDAALQQLPEVPSPTELPPAQARTLAEELNLPPMRTSIRDERAAFALPKESQAAAATPPPPPPTTPANAIALLPDLSKSYPQSPLVDSSVQTTPRHKLYELPETEFDYSNGQPVDDVLSATLLLLHGSDDWQRRHDNDEAAALPLRFAPPAQPPQHNEDVQSFLLDFGLAGDPMRGPQPPPTGESNASSEWEFLDN